MSYYNGPQKTGEAIAANLFCQIDATATPDTVIMADAPAVPVYVSTTPLDSDQPIAGMWNDTEREVMIKLAAGQNPTAGQALYPTTGGEATTASGGAGVPSAAVCTQPAAGGAGTYCHCLLKNILSAS